MPDNIEIFISNRNRYFHMWLDLYEMLCVTLWHVTTPKNTGIFRVFGPRRKSNAYNRLTKEKQMLLLILEDVGICPIKSEDCYFSQLCESHTIETAHRALSEMYAQCAMNSAYLGKRKIERWLAERARIHKLHTQIFSA